MSTTTAAAPRAAPEAAPPAGPYHGVWATRNAPLAYRVLPKCGCSSVGQVMHHIDHGAFYPRLIHDPDAPLLKWRGGPDDAQIAARFAEGPMVRFTLARNPYRRILSCYADKIVGPQEDGSWYRGGLLHEGMKAYGASFGMDMDVVRNFHAFLRFVEDGLRDDAWDRSDWHWRPCAEHLRYTAEHNPAWALDHAGHVETFAADLDGVLRAAGVAAGDLVARAPRENVTALPDIPITQFYRHEERRLMQRVYGEDFDLFGYAANPNRRAPAGPVDVAALNRALATPRQRRTWLKRTTAWVECHWS